VLEAYERHARPGEPLGVFGDALPVLRYQSSPRVVYFDEPAAALELLAPSRQPRGFLALRDSELWRLNAAHRASTNPRSNLLVLDARKSELVLSTSRLAPGERDRNPFREFFPDVAPEPDHPMQVELGGRLELVGWELRDLGGELARQVIAGEPYELSLFFRVLAPLSHDWQIFVHVDGFQQRLNADHAPLAGLYPSSAWLAGDWVRDRHRLRVDASFLPGVYGVHAGLYRGAERLPVTRGAPSSARIFLGELRVD
jgi:hypothetical protein